ncbi:FAD-dependent monooxygenase [Streptomyces sp. MST-110588]|uniref:FAD-dependent monooxygenase n=1 Tax=Streptomyces sp. MST-110588 TaxID=2833628 RepID=UPI001F5C5873|nr:FAD-dependent monooxygenase [Streptomyces sp. MST-110588]UNO38707.1 FAD-dependent monooxygenase [Streptomyces sp. MST-110588]
MEDRAEHPARTAIVIGGGIGGLTAAAALHRRGWSVTVLERAASLEPVGAGIALAPNAQRALDTIDVGDAVRSVAVRRATWDLRLPGGHRLSRTTDTAAVRRFGGPVVIQHRADVVNLLASRLPTGAVRTGVTARLADPGDPARPDRPARVHLTDRHGRPHPSGHGDHLTADLVVAADGIHSATRRLLFPTHPEPRYAGVTTWRMVVPAPDRTCAAHETWGRGGLWGTIPLSDGRVYAYAQAAVPSGGSAPDDERAELLRRFGTWHHPVPAILRATDPAAILRNDVYSGTRPVPAFHHGRVALLGDAVHPMTPSLGQGGCQAIEDAVVLAHLVGLATGSPNGPDQSYGSGNPPTLTAALARYTRERRPRTTEVVRRSARVSRATTWSSLPAHLLRAAGLALAARRAPDLGLRALDGIADWCPPPGAYASGTRGTQITAHSRENQ